MASADVSHLSRSYLPPAQQSYSGPSYQQSSFSAHGGVDGGYSAGSVGGGFSAPSNQYLPPVHQTLAAPAPSYTGHVEESYVAPAAPSYAAPAVHQQASFSSVGSVGGGYSAPSNEYLPPVHQTYSAPATANAINAYSSGHSVSYSSGAAEVGTQYAANGGYVYKK